MTRFEWILEKAEHRVDRLKGPANDAADAGDHLQAARLWVQAAAEILKGMNDAMAIYDRSEPDAGLHFSLFMSAAAMVKALGSLAASHQASHLLATTPPAGNA